jgi:glycosyltransferase involved in cell wall biosynthesis
MECCQQTPPSRLPDCLNSVAQQTYTHREHGVVDGAGTDGTVDVINQHTNQITAFITEPDKGIYDALNTGLKRLTLQCSNAQSINRNLQALVIK